MSNEGEVSIGKCASDEVELLEKLFPTGPSRFHEQRYKSQADCLSEYLIARIDSKPVGHLHLKWQGTDSKVVKAKIGVIPEFNGIAVAKEFQSKGIGSKLIQEAESLARQRGADKVGLGVSIENKRARKLYEKLGYKQWGYGEYVDSWTRKNKDGNKEVIKDECIYLVKDLKHE